MNENFSAFLMKGASKIFHSKNIFTIGHLCSVNSNDLNSLPFRAPKLDNFVNFINRFEDAQSKVLDQEQQQSVLSKISACTNPVVYMGSVEEEMEKLESTNCFDTSIECEKENLDEADKSAKSSLASLKAMSTEQKATTTTSSSIEMDIDTSATSEKQIDVDPIKSKISKDLELMEKDLHEKISDLFKLKHLINSGIDDKKVEYLREMKSKHDELAMQLRMRFY